MSLTLDAMASADLLRSCENDSGVKANSISVTDSSLYSITRLMSGGPQDFYVTLQAKARDGYSGNYTPSTPADTNVENSLFAKEATATEGNLTYFRHLYNLRWADNWASGQTAAYTLAAQSLGATGLNWTGGSVTVYCPAQGKNFRRRPRSLGRGGRGVADHSDIAQKCNAGRRKYHHHEPAAARAVLSPKPADRVRQNCLTATSALWAKITARSKNMTPARCRCAGQC